VARFLFLGAAAVEFLAWSGRAPDVLHAHDWQAAAAPLLLRVGDDRAAGRSPYAATATVLTIHNLEFQGRCAPASLADVPALAPPPAWATAALTDARSGLHGAPDANLLKAAIEVCDAVTTVSPPYAAEVVGGGGHGAGLEASLRAAAARGAFVGITNGIDVDSYDPATDPALPARLARGGGARVAGWKAECKAALFKELGLAPPPAPDGGPAFLMAVVSRLTPQKGTDGMLLEGIEAALAAGAAVVVLGTAPDPAVDARFRAAADAAAARSLPARFAFTFSEPLARRIYAGADAVFMPSVFEPCGLTQLIALRYGGVPIARRTGGLAATLADVDDTARPEHERNAFVFDAPTTDEAVTAVRRALAAHGAPGGRAWWEGVLVERAAAQDWSWARPGAEYLRVYRGVVDRRRR
jgi:starch synthase